MRTVNIFTGIPQVGEMPEIFTVDIAESRRSIRKLAALEARTVCFGHGRAADRGRGGREDHASSRPACRSSTRRRTPPTTLELRCRPGSSTTTFELVFASTSDLNASASVSIGGKVL